MSQEHITRFRHAVIFLISLVAAGGCAVNSSGFKPDAGAPAQATFSLKPYTIEADVRQIVDFRTAAVPGNIFKIVIPEIVTDKDTGKEGTLVPWSQDATRWDISDDRARWECQIPHVIRMKVDVNFGEQIIEAGVEMTNLSDRTWEHTTAFTCFAFYSAPIFDDPRMERVYFPVAGKWRSVADLFAEHNPGHSSYTFFPVAGGPALGDMNICRLVPQRHPQVVDYGAACVVSRDGQWVAGVNADRPAFVFCNREERCIHANPVYDPIAPGETARTVTHIRILRGGIEDFERAVHPHT